jgi:hypothetical protein
MMKFDFGSLELPFEATWPVVAKVPQDGGTIQEQEFIARFRLVPEDDVKKADADRSDPVKALMHMAVIGIEGEEFTPELLNKLMGRGYVKMALSKAYAEFVMGVPAKN